MRPNVAYVLYLTGVEHDPAAKTYTLRFGDAEATVSANWVSATGLEAAHRLPPEGWGRFEESLYHHGSKR